jgi:uncharacterized protein (TIGR02147 family)
MIFEHTDYRGYLKSVLAQRIAKNPKYSLRAMARSFSISPALLSQISNGQRNLTALNAVRLAKKLGLNKRETDYFCSLVQYQEAKHIESKALLLEKINSLRSRRDIHNLPLDTFKAMADWYHYAIIEALRIQKFKPTPKNLSKRLGISPIEAEVALERLVRLKVIEPTENGGYRQCQAGRKAVSTDATLALQTFHQQMLEKAIASLSSQTPKQRHIGSETFALDVSQIPEAQRRINDFLDDMADFFASGEKPSEVYHLGIQLFRLTRKEES